MMAVVRHVPGNIHQISVAELDHSRSAFGDLTVNRFQPTAGWNFVHKINSEVVASTVTGGGSVTGTDSMAVLNTGAQNNSSAKIETLNAMRYIPGLGAMVRFSALFTTGVAGNTQIIGAGDATDGIFFGFNGVAFGVMHRNNGSDTWVAKTAWNLDKMDGTTASDVTLDPTKGNVYQIRYQWLGFGAIIFAIQNPSTGAFVDVHRIEYGNVNTAVSLTNPALPIMAATENTSNNTSIILKTASAVGGTEGVSNGTVFVLHHTFDTSKTSEQPVLSIRNSTTHQDITNKTRVKPRILSVATEGSKPVVIKGYQNATITSTSSWSDFSSLTSVVQTNSASTSSTGGNLRFAIQMAKTDQDLIDLEPFVIDLRPGDHLTVTAQSANAAEAFVAVTWEESF